VSFGIEREMTTENAKNTENLQWGTAAASGSDLCDVCGSTDIVEIKCKIMCRNCGTILRSCSDL
jgi:rubredoxin